MKKFSICALFVLLAYSQLFAFGTSDVDGKARPAIDVNEVHLYNYNEVPANSQHIGIVTGTTIIDRQKAITDAKKQAAKIGANGITIYRDEVIPIELFGFPVITFGIEAYAFYVPK